VFAVIMTGGSGTRFWPLSRKRRPKQFLDFTGKGPMVVDTCNRLAPLSRDEEIILVLGEEHLDRTKDLFGNRKVHLLAEPVGRNTAPCIGLGALYARHLGCEQSVAFLPADHFIGDTTAFIDALHAAAERANSGGIVTLGIVPYGPETGYGYIHRGGPEKRPGNKKIYRVTNFIEKPDLEKAKIYLSTGEYYWNAGIFVATPGTILEEVKIHLPSLYKGLMRIEKALGRDEFKDVLGEVYQGQESISFDYAIMEKTESDVYVIPTECGWSDVGSWASLHALKSSEHDDEQNLAWGDVFLVDSKGNLVSGRSGRMVACLGLKNCLIVDTPDALLVADLNCSQDIRKIVDQLRKKGKEALL
jgi:mannose-1-phosphate guanylyltransferase